MKDSIISRKVLILLIIGIVTVLLWQFQIGRYIIYPFTILGTWFHEMGHGITAIILGGSFERLELFPDSSGIAFHSGTLMFGGIGRAMTAAGGPVFPFIIGSILIIISVKLKSSNIILFTFGLIMFVTVALWVRTLFGILSISLIAGVLLILSLRANKNVNSFVIQLLGIEACLSFYLNIEYYFSSGGIIDGKSYYSDTQVIADNLFLPYWFWGGMIVTISVIILFFLFGILSKKEILHSNNKIA